MPLIDGKLLAEQLRENLRNEVKRMGIIPGLDVILIGNDQESLRYVKMKQRAVENLGGKCRVHFLDKTDTEQILALILKLNEDPDVNGILVQLPLPDGLDTDRIISSIAAHKDVDGFHPLNLGLIYTNRQYFASCAALGIIEIMGIYAGPSPRVLLVGDSFDVIKPLANLLMARDCPVTIVPGIEAWLDLKCYDVVVLEKGEPQSIEAELFRAGSLVIDAGFHWIDGRSCGNAITSGFQTDDTPWLLPVPGGLGPLLITMLLKNLLQAVKING